MTWQELHKSFRYIFSKDKMPKVEHFAAIVFTSIYIPGDERSRTNPGHGYPESRESVCKYIHFDNEAALLAWIEAKSEPNYVVIRSKPVEIVTETKLKIV